MAQPLKQMPYQPLGDLKLDFSEHDVVSNFRRELDLDTAIATVSYVVSGVRFTREVFSSPVDQVIVVHLTTDRQNQISFTATMTSPQRASVTTERGDTLILRGQNGDAFGIQGRLKFEAQARLVLDEGNT